MKTRIYLATIALLSLALIAHRTPAASPATAPTGPQWEYLEMDVHNWDVAWSNGHALTRNEREALGLIAPSEDPLSYQANRLGERGWEFAGTSPDRIWFKRPLSR